jgi:tRNA A37 methylthiotransferase MiaB
MESNRKWIGWKGKVLFDETIDEGIKGRNFAYKPVFVDGEIKIGQAYTVEIIDATVKRLVGKIAS